MEEEDEEEKNENEKLLVNLKSDCSDLKLELVSKIEHGQTYYNTSVSIIYIF